MTATLRSNLVSTTVRNRGVCFSTRGRCLSTSRYTSPSSSTTTWTPSQAEVQSARSFCLNQLRQFDTPAFILQPYIPQQARDAYIAIRALNLEIARAADVTDTPTIAAMRLQYQREAITKSLAGSPPKQPMSVLLAHAVDDLHRRSDGRARLSKSWFMRLVTAREQRLDETPFSDLAALESYAENTYSTLMYLTLQAMPMASLAADHVASHIGKATGIAAVLRGLPLLAFPPSNSGQAREGTITLPLDIMAEHGVREEDVLRQGPEAQGLRDAVFAVATRANDHLITARQMLADLRAGRDVGHDFEHSDDREHATAASTSSTALKEVEQSFGAFMPAIATNLWLELLQKHQFDAFAPKLRTTDWRLPWKSFWAYSRRRI